MINNEFINNALKAFHKFNCELSDELEKLNISPEKIGSASFMAIIAILCEVFVRSHIETAEKVLGVPKEKSFIVIMCEIAKDLGFGTLQIMIKEGPDKENNPSKNMH